ncbi:MAG: YihY family inner membrane protein [Candidatus Eisenbacteria bacterium]|nr:YihY family inner membrane protein [Candidatus Eisenbacteria bacterium]
MRTRSATESGEVLDPMRALHPMATLREVPRVFVTAYRRLNEERVPEAAAAIAFFAVFSLFPLLLLLVAAGTILLDSPKEQERLLDAVLRFIPVSRHLVRENVLTVIRARQTVGWIGAIGLFWSASSAFSILVRNLSRAWVGAKPLGLLIERLRALAVVGSLVALVLLLLVFLTVLRLPEEWLASERTLSVILQHLQSPSGALLLLLLFVVMTLLYRWLPQALVLWREAAVAGLAAAVVLTLTTGAFTWFLGSGFVRYNVIYGSLGALLALLSWVYMAGAVTLSGAHLAASLALHTRGGSKRGENAGAGSDARGDEISHLSTSADDREEDEE